MGVIMKKILTLFLIAAMILSSYAFVFANGSLVIVSDTHLKYLANKFDNLTIEEDAVLYLENWKPDPQGIEITRSLVVRERGDVHGGIIIFERGAYCEGLKLYYMVGQSYKELTASLDDLCDLFPNEDYRPTFRYDESVGIYVLEAEPFKVDPFENIPAQGGQGGQGSEDPVPGGQGQENPAKPGVETIFKDVNALDWFRPFLQNAYNNGIVTGTSKDTFSPNNNLTAGQILVMAANIRSMQDGDNYDFDAAKDPARHWSFAFLEYCQMKQIVDDRFDDRLDEFVTRGEMAYVFGRALRIDSYRGKRDASFSDVAGHRYEEEIMRLAISDIVTGYSNGTYRPEGLVTRAESCVFVSNLLDIIMAGVN